MITLASVQIKIQQRLRDPPIIRFTPFGQVDSIIWLRPRRWIKLTPVGSDGNWEVTIRTAFGLKTYGSSVDIDKILARCK